MRTRQRPDERQKRGGLANADRMAPDAPASCADLISQAQFLGKAVGVFLAARRTQPQVRPRERRRGRPNSAVERPYRVAGGPTRQRVVSVSGSSSR